MGLKSSVLTGSNFCLLDDWLAERQTPSVCFFSSGWDIIKEVTLSGKSEKENESGQDSAPGFQIFTKI